MLPERGVYLVEFELAQDRQIRVGKLGEIQFATGAYVYVGSAQTGLHHRVARHARRRKPLRWHIDYLAHHAPAIAVWAWDAGKQAECAVAERLADVYASVPGFGCSDCRCSSHLFLSRGAQAAGLAEELLGLSSCAALPLRR